MRKKLAEHEGVRKKFQAVFVRVGKKTNYKGYSEDTILLKQVYNVETNQLVTDHIWMNYTKSFEQVTLTEGTRIEFEARVKVYQKGYVNPRLNLKTRQSDFKLSHPTKIKKIEIAR